MEKIGVGTGLQIRKPGQDRLVLELKGAKVADWEGFDSGGIHAYLDSNRKGTKGLAKGTVRTRHARAATAGKTVEGEVCSASRKQGKLLPTRRV